MEKTMGMFPITGNVPKRAAWRFGAGENHFPGKKCTPKRKGETVEACL